MVWVYLSRLSGYNTIVKRIITHKFINLSAVFFIIVLSCAVLLLYNANNQPLSTSASATASQPLSTADPAPRVGIQIGHLDVDKLPGELSKLWWNFGAQVGNYTEIATVTKIAELAKQYLNDKGVMVDLLPATIPEGYEADCFVSIHADGNDYDYVSGYKVASSVFDTSSRSTKLAELIETAYQTSTKMDQDKNITTDMTEYYAFNFIKYQHAISASTPGVIIEVGYITNATDRKTIIKQPSLSARGISDGVLAFLDDQN
ncbi:MAG: N-acetylmuramoyl-L-alanine amidase [Patescibacteria group bacterium]|jgi:N-acetylmuramoyl-L-alanine amidase